MFNKTTTIAVVTEDEDNVVGDDPIKRHSTLSRRRYLNYKSGTTDNTRGFFDEFASHRVKEHSFASRKFDNL